MCSIYLATLQEELSSTNKVEVVIRPLVRPDVPIFFVSAGAVGHLRLVTRRLLPGPGL